MDEINVLPRYRGTCVHDGHFAYNYYTRCRHALCGVHLLRELTYFEELSAETKAWAAPLKELLLEMKEAVERVSAEGGKQLAADELRSLTESYDRLSRRGAEGAATARGAGAGNESRRATCCCGWRKKGRGAAVPDGLRCTF